MAAAEESTFVPEGFSGRVPLFPLPNLVLFPHVLQPLHIFEPRYRSMVAKALEGEGLIAMALLRPGWEGRYEGRPEVHGVACLGRIAAWHRLDDGRYNLLLGGLGRVEIVGELPPDKPFREARVALLPDVLPTDGAAQRGRLQGRLLEIFSQMLGKAPHHADQLAPLLRGKVALGTLTDLMGFSLPLEMQLKVELLHERNVDRRASLLVQWLDATGQGGADRRWPQQFPPEASAN